MHDGNVGQWGNKGWLNDDGLRKSFEKAMEKVETKIKSMIRKEERAKEEAQELKDKGKEAPTCYWSKLTTRRAILVEAIMKNSKPLGDPTRLWNKLYHGTSGMG